MRGPAAFCGVVGYKPTVGTWPMDGVFPMSRTFDAIGPLTRSAKDAAIVWSALTKHPMPQPLPAERLRLAKPAYGFFDSLDGAVSKCLEGAIDAMKRAGVSIIDVDVPQLREVEKVFETVCRTETVATFGRERFLRSQSQMNPDVAARIGFGLTPATDEYIRNLWRHRELAQESQQLFREIDGWIGPTKKWQPPVYGGSYTTLEAHNELAAKCVGPTRAANVFGLCAITLPVQRYGSDLPVGLQVMSLGGEDSRLLSIALTLEQIFGEPPVPAVMSFLQGART